MISRVATALLVCVCCAHVLVGQAPQQPTFRVQVDAVEIDASVTDAQGNVVTDLTRDDFEILEDGKPQTITSFALVNLPRTRAERPLFSAASPPITHQHSAASAPQQPAIPSGRSHRRI